MSIYDVTIGIKAAIVADSEHDAQQAAISAASKIHTRDITVTEIIARTRPDADEEIDPDWLLANGFTGGNDEPDVDIYQRHSENLPIYQRRHGGPRVQVTIRFRNGEQVASTLSLAWDYNGPFNVGLRYAIADNPTRGHVIRLCKALGFDSA